MDDTTLDIPAHCYQSYQPYRNTCPVRQSPIMGAIVILIVTIVLITATIWTRYK